MLFTSEYSELYFWIYSHLQIIQANSFFSYKELLSNYVYKRFSNHSHKIITRHQWSHEFFNKFFLTKSNFKIKYQYRSSPSEMFFWESALWVCSWFVGESLCGGVISIELHVQLCGDYSSVLVFSCGFRFAFAEHFFFFGRGALFIASGFLLLSKHLSLMMQFL